MENWKKDPEVRYREGYEEGARALFKALRGIVPGVTLQKIQAWLEADIGPWRLKAQQAAAGDKGQSKVFPPPLKL